MRAGQEVKRGVGVVSPVWSVAPFRCWLPGVSIGEGARPSLP